MMPRKSDEAHALNGTSSRALPEESAPSGRPRVPKDLQPEEKKIFRAVCKTLAQRRVLTEGDQQLLRLLAIVVARHRRAVQHIAVEGEVVTYTRLDKKGEAVETSAKNLWLAIADKSAEEIRACCDRLGLTPMSRSRVRKTTSEDVPPIVFL